MKIVALSGWKGSGKDMVADYLVKNHGFQKLSFAGVLKDMAASQYNVPRSHFDDRNFKEAPIFDLPARSEDAWSDAVLEMVYPHLRTQFGEAPSSYMVYKGNVYLVPDIMPATPRAAAVLYHTPRSLAIIEGSTKRAVASDYWVKVALSRTKPDGLYVISDVRFKSELRQLTIAAGGENNVLSIRVERFDSTSAVDPSERDLDDWQFDAYLNNKENQNITKQDVFEQASKLIELLWVNENASISSIT